jgi:uncharacterized spore protein YtfJ
MDQLSLAENVDTLFHSLENFTQREGVIGNPFHRVKKPFYPLFRLPLGTAAANASMSKGQSGSSTSSMLPGSNTGNNSGTGALGLGAKLNTEAIIVIDEQSRDVSVLPMSTVGAGQIMTRFPRFYLDLIRTNSPANPSRAVGSPVISLTS